MCLRVTSKKAHLHVYEILSPLQSLSSYLLVSFFFLAFDPCQVLQNSNHCIYLQDTCCFFFRMPGEHLWLRFLTGISISHIFPNWLCTPLCCWYWHSTSWSHLVHPYPSWDAHSPYSPIWHDLALSCGRGLMLIPYQPVHPYRYWHKACPGSFASWRHHPLIKQRLEVQRWADYDGVLWDGKCSLGRTSQGLRYQICEARWCGMSLNIRASWLLS